MGADNGLSCVCHWVLTRSEKIWARMSTPRPTFRASSKNTMMNHALGVGNLAIPVIYSYLLCRTHISPVLSSSLHSAGLSLATFIRQLSRVCTWYIRSLIPKAKACIHECSSLASIFMNTKSHVALTVRFSRIMFCLVNSFIISIQHCTDTYFRDIITFQPNCCKPRASTPFKIPCITKYNVGIQPDWTHILKAHMW